MSDSEEALWQGVEQKAADKLDSADGGLLEHVIFPIFIPEAYHAVFDCCEAGVGDSHPVGITGQVFKDVLRVFDRFSYTDDPFVFIESVFQLQ